MDGQHESKHFISANYNGKAQPILEQMNLFLLELDSNKLKSGLKYLILKHKIQLFLNMLEDYGEMEYSLSKLST